MMPDETPTLDVAAQQADDMRTALRQGVTHDVKRGRTYTLAQIADILERLLTDEERAKYDGWPIASALREVFPGVTGEKLAESATAQLDAVSEARWKRKRRALRNLNHGVSNARNRS